MLIEHDRAAWLHRRYTLNRARVVDIAAEAGVDPATIYTWLRKAGEPLRGPPGRRSLTGITTGQISRALREAPTFRAAAQRLGVDDHTLRERARADGLVGGDGIPTDVEISDLSGRYQAGATLAALADEVGVSVRTIRRWLIEAGVAMRPAGRRRADGLPPAEPWRR